MSFCINASSSVSERKSVSTSAQHSAFDIAQYSTSVNCIRRLTRYCMSKGQGSCPTDPHAVRCVPVKEATAWWVQSVVETV